MSGRDERDNIAVDPALDRQLRQLIGSAQLSPAQHARIQQRIGLAAQAPRRTPNATGNDAGAHWEHVPTSVNDDEQETKVMSLPTFPRAGRTRRTEWLELAAVLAVVLVAVVIFAVMRGQTDGPSQPGTTPGDPTPIVALTPTPAAPTPTPPAPTPTAEPAPVVVMPVPDTDGVYRRLTVAQARLVLDAPLVFPAVTPPGLDDATVMVERLAAIEDGEPGFYVVATYHVTGGDDTATIEYIQTTMAPQNPPGGEMSVVELSGTRINKARIPHGRSPVQLVYWWQSGATHPRVSAGLAGGVTEELVEQLTAEILIADTRAVSVAPPPVDQPYTIAETVFTSDLGITIDGITAADDSALPTPAPGMRYVLVTGHILNGRAEPVTVQSILTFTLLDNQGGAYEYEGTGSTIPDSNLSPGETVQFELAFQVPQDQTDFLLSFEPYTDTDEGRISFTLTVR